MIFSAQSARCVVNSSINLQECSKTLFLKYIAIRSETNVNVKGNCLRKL